MVVPRFPPLIDAAGIAQLKDIIHQGLATAEQFTNEQVQFRRLNQSTGRYENNGDIISLISIKFGLREVSDTTTLVPVSVRSSDADIMIWDGDYDLEVGDRFDFHGMTCEVSAVYPGQYGRVVAEINLKQ